MYNLSVHLPIVDKKQNFVTDKQNSALKRKTALLEFLFSLFLLLILMLEPDSKQKDITQRRSLRPLSLIPDLDVPPVIPRW